MPHMAPFMWSVAPASVLLVLYLIILYTPTAHPSIKPMTPHKQPISWNWMYDN